MKLTDSAMRAALTARDPAMDGRFVFGVITTGICCRPVCRSRAPRPENLRFFASVSAAQAAGFRPCKRCRPELPGRADEQRILELARWLLANPQAEASLKQLARRAHWSPAHLQRRFTALLGASPREFQEAARLGRLKSLLRGRGAIGRALLDAGFGSHSEGYRVARRALGMAPARYRAGAPQEVLAYAIKRGSLGWVVLAASTQGVCFVRFGDSAPALRDALAAEFPAATLDGAGDSPRHRAVSGWLDEVLSAIDGPRTLAHIPLDLRGTAFQIRVWKALRRIGRGSTLSYAQLAGKLHQPRASRAVAAACAHNRIAVLVPCHRVVRGDGSLAGYRWGVERKRVLLSNEKA